MADRFTKSYAIIKSQWLSRNILDEYLPFIATIILDEGMEVVDEIIICSKLNEKYRANFQPTFVRQVISNAMSKDVIKKSRGTFIANKDALKKITSQIMISNGTGRPLWMDLVSMRHSINIACPPKKLLNIFLLF